MARAIGLASLGGILAPLLISAVDALSGRGRLALLFCVPALTWAALRPAPAFGPAHAATPVPASRPSTAAAWRATRWWVAIVCAVSPEFAFMVWGSARLQDAGLAAAAAAAGGSALQIGMTAGRLLSSRAVGRVPLVSCGVTLACAGAIGCAAPIAPVWIVLASFVAGLGLGPLYPVLIDQLVRTPGFGARHGAAVGALGTGTAMLVGPPLLSAIATVVPLRIAFLAAVPPLLLVGLVHRLGRLHETHGPR